MQRLCVFLALLLTTTTSQAQTAAPAAPATPAPAPATPGAAPATTTPATPAKHSGTQNARLAPGGVVAGSSSFPLGLQLTLDNTLGNGVLAPGYQAQPQWGTDINLRPSLRVPNVEGLPKLRLSASFDFYVNNWLGASTNNNAYERQIQVADATVAAILPAIYIEELTGIAVSLVFSGRAPLSTASRQANLITSLGASAQFMWNSPEADFGSFFIQYNPGIRGNIFSQVGTSYPCSTPSAPILRSSTAAADGIGELGFTYGRDAEVLPNGECVMQGRQTLFSIANNINTGWSLGDHNISLGLNWAHAFIRGLADKPGLSSPFASGQNFRETSGGSLSYTYTVPADVQIYLTGGIANQNPSAYTNQGALRFPLYDFITPANNLSSAFFDVTVGL